MLFWVGLDSWYSGKVVDVWGRCLSLGGFFGGKRLKKIFFHLKEVKIYGEELDRGVHLWELSGITMSKVVLFHLLKHIGRGIR